MNHNVKALQKIIDKLVVPNINKILQDLDTTHSIKIIVGKEIGESEEWIDGKNIDVDFYYVEVICDTRVLYSPFTFNHLCDLILTASRYIVPDRYAIQIIFIVDGDVINYHNMSSSWRSHPFDETLGRLKDAFKYLLENSIT